MEAVTTPQESAQAIWQDCLSRISSRIKRQTLHTWFLPIKAITFEDDALTLEVANQFAVDWINEHFRSLIDWALAEAVGTDGTFLLTVRPAGAQAVAPDAENGRTAGNGSRGGNGSGDAAPVSVQYGPPAQANRSPAGADELRRYMNQPEGIVAADPGQRTAPARRRGNTVAGLALSNRYTFDTFVVGDSNQFAHAAALNVAESGGSSRFNPLYIYGKVGLGKTHLAQAIGHHVLDLNPRAQVVYATSEKFTNDFISSLSTGNTAEFTQRYRSVDLLIVDDIQFFTGKESTQAQFFHTFNDLYQNGRRIVLTSDRPPREISGLEERLLSRFGWGLVTDIQPPDLETRIAILKKKTQNEQIEVPEEALVYIADHVTSNIRDLEGSLIRLLAYASLFGRDVTLELTREVLQDTFKSNRPPITIETIQKAVAAHFSLPLETMWTKKKTQEIVTARQIAMYLTRELTGAPLKTIGAQFGGRDHSTVIHACSQVGTRARQDPSFKQHIDQIVNNLYS